MHYPILANFSSDITFSCCILTLTTKPRGLKMQYLLFRMQYVNPNDQFLALKQEQTGIMWLEQNKCPDSIPCSSLSPFSFFFFLNARETFQPKLLSVFDRNHLVNSYINRFVILTNREENVQFQQIFFESFEKLSKEVFCNGC